MEGNVNERSIVMFSNLPPKSIANVAGESSILIVHDKRENLHFCDFGKQLCSLHRIAITATVLLPMAMWWILIELKRGKKNVLHFGLNGVNETYSSCTTHKIMVKKQTRTCWACMSKMIKKFI